MPIYKVTFTSFLIISSNKTSLNRIKYRKLLSLQSIHCLVNKKSESWHFLSFFRKAKKLFCCENVAEIWNELVAQVAPKVGARSEFSDGWQKVVTLVVWFLKASSLFGEWNGGESCKGLASAADSGSCVNSRVPEAIPIAVAPQPLNGKSLFTCFPLAVLRLIFLPNCKLNFYFSASLDDRKFPPIMIIK